jgi:mRNA interferase RelE/StbE
MAWRVELSGLARRNLEDLDPQVARRILAFLHDRIAVLDDPRSIGEALKGARLGALWKYRVGDYRVVADLQDSTLVVLVVKIGNRREVYRQ